MITGRDQKIKFFDKFEKGIMTNVGKEGGKLSGGQKQIMALIRAIIQQKPIILLDEPTNHLDLESIEGLIKGINEFNGGIVVITHDIYLIESIVRADIFQVSKSNIVKFPGEFEDYCEMVYSSNKD